MANSTGCVWHDPDKTKRSLFIAKLQGGSRSFCPELILNKRFKRPSKPFIDTWSLGLGDSRNYPRASIAPDTCPRTAGREVALLTRRCTRCHDRPHQSSVRLADAVYGSFRNML